MWRTNHRLLWSYRCTPLHHRYTSRRWQHHRGTHQPSPHQHPAPVCRERSNMPCSDLRAWFSMIGMYVDIATGEEARIWKKIAWETERFLGGSKLLGSLVGSFAVHLYNLSLINLLHRNHHRSCTSHYCWGGQRSHPTYSSGVHHNDPSIETGDADYKSNVFHRAVRTSSSVGLHQETQAYTVGGRTRRMDENDGCSMDGMNDQS